MQDSLDEAEYVQFVLPDELCCLKEFVSSLAISIHKAPGTVPDSNTTASFASNVTIIYFDSFFDVIT